MPPFYSLLNPPLKGLVKDKMHVYVRRLLFLLFFRKIRKIRKIRKSLIPGRERGFSSVKFQLKQCFLPKLADFVFLSQFRIFPDNGLFFDFIFIFC